MTDHKDTEARLQEKFWDEIKDSPFMMVGLQGIDNDWFHAKGSDAEGTVQHRSGQGTSG